MNTASARPVLVITRCSWRGCGACDECKARAAGRRIVQKYGDALLRLADG